MGCRLGRQEQTLYFQHNDVDQLDTVLKSLRLPQGSLEPSSNVFVAVESVYSMDGDLAPLEKILTVAERYGAMVIVDEAHG